MNHLNSHLIASMLVFSQILCLPLSVVASDNDEPDHFEGLPSESLPEALYHLRAYNMQLAEIVLSEELTAEDLGNIHIMSYTMENALKKLAEEVSELADTLEAVHHGSETMEFDEVSTAAKKYLIKSDQLFGR